MPRRDGPSQGLRRSFKAARTPSGWSSCRRSRCDRFPEVITAATGRMPSQLHVGFLPFAAGHLRRPRPHRLHYSNIGVQRDNSREFGTYLVVAGAASAIIVTGLTDPCPGVSDHVWSVEEIVKLLDSYPDSN